MTKKRTSKSNYPSRYSPDGWVSAAQYITEFVCEKKAQKENKELPIKFWEISEWKKYFRYQITIANNLLKDFPEEAIIAALKDRRCWKTYSLRSPFLQSIIKEKQAEIKERDSVEYNVVESENIKHKSNNNKKSIISKLRELDE
jgi:hypothetical protein